jgi:hypothetical protein
MLITIKHVPTNKEVAFLPYLTNFSDSFKSDWQQNYVIGRWILSQISKEQQEP